jgi:dTMP kinase
MISNLLKLIPVPDVSFLIDVPEEVAFNRKNDVPDIAYLKERRSNYLKVGKWFNMIVIDGSKNIIEVESSILCEALNHIKEELE